MGVFMLWLEFWHWWAIALILVVVEALSPSGFFAGMAMAAALTGAAYLAFPEMGLLEQFGIFGVLSFLFYFLFNYLLAKLGIGQGKKPAELAQEFMGKDFELGMAIKNGYGELEINGVNWSLKGPDVPSGSTVRVIGLDGDMLVVLPVKNAPAEPQA